jgi:cysteine desulfurase
MPAAPIYLDNNATTPIDPRVVQAMARAWEKWGANPASQHEAGRKARRMLEEAREGIATLLGAKTSGMETDQVIFTSGGTEANNLALLGLGGPEAGGRRSGVGGQEAGRSVIISAIEHPSVVGAAEERRRGGCDVARAAVDGNGVINVGQLKELLDQSTALVSVMLANNETGVIQPVAEIAALCQERGIVLHTDAVQAVGKIAVNFRELGADAMTVAPHKFHGPLGIGALILRYGVTLEPQLFGGFQQGGLRPGTENVALAVGFFEALRLWHEEASARETRMRALRDELERSLRAELPDVFVVGEPAPRLPTTSCISFPGINRQALVMALDMAGVACSTGSACASGSSQPSPTLLAMGLPAELIESAIRLSLSALTTAAEATQAVRRIINAVNHLRSKK